MQISAYKRSKQGTGASRRLRITGRTPGILYGGTAEPQLIEIDHNPLWFALQKEVFHASILHLEIDGKAQKVLLRDVQYHPYKQLILHIDFQRVDAKTRLHTTVPLHFIGEDKSDAVTVDKQLVSHVTTEIEIVCLPADLPEFLAIDLSGLKKNSSFRLRDAKLPRGVSVSKRLQATNPVLASAAAAPAAEAAAAASAEESTPAE